MLSPPVTRSSLLLYSRAHSFRLPFPVSRAPMCPIHTAITLRCSSIPTQTYDRKLCVPGSSRTPPPGHLSPRPWTFHTNKPVVTPSINHPHMNPGQCPPPHGGNGSRPVGCGRETGANRPNAVSRPPGPRDGRDSEAARGGSPSQGKEDRRPGPGGQGQGPGSVEPGPAQRTPMNAPKCSKPQSPLFAF